MREGIELTGDKRYANQTLALVFAVVQTTVLVLAGMVGLVRRKGDSQAFERTELYRRTYELADLHKVNLLGSVTWAFEFEDQPYFAGFRVLASNGIDHPVLNVFRMFAKMSGQRLPVTSSAGTQNAGIQYAGPIDAGAL